MKRKVLIGAVLAIALSLVAGGTLAYFTADDIAHNVITTGKVDITIVETQKGDGDTEVEFPEEGISGVMPGTSVSKIVRVKNIGEGEAWIRVQVSKTIKSAAGDELPLTLTVEGEEVPVMDFTVGEDWLDGGDGYYYYKEAMPYYKEAEFPDNATTPLLEAITFAPQMGNEYQSSQADIVICAQAIQTANNPIPEGGDITDVWPDIDYELGYKVETPDTPDPEPAEPPADPDAD